jgi:hypothetical protein
MSGNDFRVKGEKSFSSKGEVIFLLTSSLMGDPITALPFKPAISFRNRHVVAPSNAE